MTEDLTPRGKRLEASSSCDAVKAVVAEVLTAGAEVVGESASTEVLNLSVESANPRDRILPSTPGGFDLTIASARLAWMIAGSNRLADIAFYTEGVQRMSDDGITLPGSNYGQRLFAGAPGTNQIDGAIRRLSKDHTSRRGAAVVWEPADAVRDSADIPCVFTLHFLIRAGRLFTTLHMRSNNAFRLLGPNLFEFGVIAELVANELDVPLGPFTVNADSMHVLHTERKNAEIFIETAAPGDGPMPPMPSEGSLKQAYLLARKEASLRHETHLIARENLAVLRARAEGLDRWWTDIHDLLLSHVLLVVGREQVAEQMVRGLSQPLIAGGMAHIEKWVAKAKVEESEQLFGDVGSTATGTGDGLGDTVKKTVGPAERAHIDKALRDVVAEIQAESGIHVLHDEYVELLDEMVAETALAARDDSSADARLSVERSRVEAALDRMRA